MPVSSTNGVDIWYEVTGDGPAPEGLAERVASVTAHDFEMGDADGAQDLVALRDAVEAARTALTAARSAEAAAQADALHG